MDSSSLPHEEVKDDEIPSNDDQQSGEKNDLSLEKDENIINNKQSEENNNDENETGKAEEITNSIVNNLIDITNEKEINDINDEDKDDNKDNKNDDKNNTSNSEINNESKEEIDTDQKEENEKDQNKNEIDIEKENNIDDENAADNKNNDDDQAEENENTNNEGDEITNNEENTVMEFSQTFSDEDVQYAFDQMYENGKVPETSMFHQLLQLIYREKANAINDQDYDRAKRLENMVSSINRENDSYSYSYSMTPESQSRYLEDRDSRLHQQLEDAKAKYKVKLDRHTESCEIKLKQLQEKQEQEVNELKSKYQDPSFLMRFNRPSQQLLYMRKRERKLALAKKYDEARQMKKLADNQQRQEEKEMQEAAQQSMQTEYVKLVEKQKKEMDKLLQFDKKTEKEIKVAKQKEIFPIKRAIKQTAIRKVNNEAKRPVFYPLSSSSLSSNPSSHFSLSLNARSYNPELARDVMAKNQTFATPRTLQKIQLLKDRNKVELNVEPIDNSTFAKLEQMNARRVKSLLPKL